MIIGMECTYNVASSQIRACITRHPHDRALKLTRMPKTAQRHVFDPGFFDMTTFFGEEINDEVSLHVAWTETVDPNSFGAPLEDG